MLASRNLVGRHADPLVHVNAVQHGFGNLITIGFVFQAHQYHAVSLAADTWLAGYSGIHLGDLLFVQAGLVGVPLGVGQVHGGRFHHHQVNRVCSIDLVHNAAQFGIRFRLERSTAVLRVNTETGIDLHVRVRLGSRGVQDVIRDGRWLRRCGGRRAGISARSKAGSQQGRSQK